MHEKQVLELGFEGGRMLAGGAKGTERSAQTDGAVSRGLQVCSCHLSGVPEQPEGLQSALMLRTSIKLSKSLSKEFKQENVGITVYSNKSLF